MKYVVTINNKKYEVEVEKGEASILKKEVLQNASPKPVTAPVSAPASTPAPASAPVQTVNAGSALPNGKPIKAPMPGVILGIKVSSGSKVKKGDTLLILEAMKMENEIVAPVDGVVEITTSKGSSVATGDTLAVIQ